MPRKSLICHKKLTIEHLENRQLLTSVPYGAEDHDVAEFLLGDIAVNVVFMESNGLLDPDTEDWNDDLRDGVKANIEEALGWWEETIQLYSDVHKLNFEVDYTHADTPIQTKYEPISRDSYDFRFWIEDFYRQMGVPSSHGFTNEIRTYNHWQREALDTNWSFTIFVVNAENDEDGIFGDANGNTVFKRAFAYPGGQFVVMPHHRPPATIAHELAHIFWAHDEYANGDSYLARRGYYNTQNTNGLNGNPNPNDREPSLMFSLSGPYANHQISQSARETMGWRDSDGDGIFDVLDVQPITVGTSDFDPETRTMQFTGNSAVRALQNQNPHSSGNDITINRITDLQYRIDAGPWMDLGEFFDYEVSFDVTTPEIPLGSERVEFRTIDDRIGLGSNTVGFDLPPDPEPEPVAPEPVEPTPTDPEPVEPTPTDPEPVEPTPTDPEPVEPTPTDPEPVEPTTPVLTNPVNQYDVSGDGFVSAIDVLRVINAINGNQPPTDGPPYVDVTGDGVISSRDALLVINFLNRRAEEPTNPNLNFISNRSAGEETSAALETNSTTDGGTQVTSSEASVADESSPSDDADMVFGEEQAVSDLLVEDAIVAVAVEIPGDRSDEEDEDASRDGEQASVTVSIASFLSSNRRGRA